MSPKGRFSTWGTVSGERADAFSLNYVQQFQRWPARALLPDLPLLNRRDAGIQHGGEHRLTGPIPDPERTNLLRRELPNGR